MLKKVPNYVKYIMTNFLVFFIYASLFRLIFYISYANLEQASFNEIKTALSFGVRFDIKLSAILIVPLTILVLMFNDRFFTKKACKYIAKIYLSFCFLCITLFYFFDFGHYDYLNTRLNASSLRFLSNLKISLQVLVQSYPIFKIILALILLLIISSKAVNLSYKKFNSTNHKTETRIKVLYVFLLLLTLSFSIYNSFTHYPLRWSQAFFSKNNNVNQFALNPVLYFFDSFKFRNEGVDIEKTKRFYPAVAKELNLSKDSLNFKRSFSFSKDTLNTQPNIVIVMLESVGVVPMSYFGNPIKTTPNMDSIIKKSTLFSKFYVHKAGTAASVFSSVTGLPDVDGVRTASRNPMVIDQRIIFDQFKDYRKLYFLGGSANWANIRGVFQSNIKNLEIYEEGSYNSEERVDVWGIDDYDLFKEADLKLEKVNKTNTPFIAYIQTASNHMPFTYPKQKDSFEPFTDNHFSKKELEKAGFDGIKRLNALKYLDFNVGKFLERAKKSGYYDNTIFLFFGDHNTSMSATTNFKKEFDLGIEVNHVPFFIHAPKYIKPKVISKFTKLVDIFPTAASVAKAPYTNYTLGTNALDSTKTSNFAFIFNISNGEPSLTLLKNDFLYSKKIITNEAHLHKLSGESLDDYKDKLPEITKSMDSLALGYYHATKYLYLNNKKRSR